MKAKSVAAALGAMLLTSAVIHAAPETLPETAAADPGVVIIEMAPQQPAAPSPEEAAAMQMLLLQYLMMQAEEQIRNI